jgi:hypothetical protein
MEQNGWKRDLEFDRTYKPDQLVSRCAKNTVTVSQVKAQGKNETKLRLQGINTVLEEETLNRRHSTASISSTSSRSSIGSIMRRLSADHSPFLDDITITFPSETGPLHFQPVHKRVYALHFTNILLFDRP